MTSLKRNRRGRLLLASAVVAVTLGVIPVAAVADDADGPWSVRPGGDVVGLAGQTTMTDTTTGMSMSCAASETRITLKRGDELANPIGQITSVTFSGCVSPNGLVFTAVSTASPDRPWPLSVISYSAGVAVGTMTDVAASFSGPGCSARIGGPTSVSSGQTFGRFINAASTVQVVSGNLRFWDVIGCFGLIHNGDAASMGTAWVVSPKTSITGSNPEPGNNS